MQRWQRAWREGIAPQFTTDELRVLRDALAADSPELDVKTRRSRNGVVCTACAMSYPLWKCRGLTDPDELTGAWINVAHAADQLGRSAPAFYFWFDDGCINARAATFAALLSEVEFNLSQRTEVS